MPTRNLTRMRSRRPARRSLRNLGFVVPFVTDCRNITRTLRNTAWIRVTKISQNLSTEHNVKITQWASANNSVCGSEHIWRYHSRDTRCLDCHTTFRQSTHTSLANDKKEHKKTCQPRTLTKEEEETSITCLSEEAQINWDNRADILKGKPKHEHGKLLYDMINIRKEIPDSRRWTSIGALAGTVCL